jgi:geranylgeranyl reductase family protein
MGHEVIDAAPVMPNPRIYLILFLPAAAPECLAELLTGMRSLPSSIWSASRFGSPGGFQMTSRENRFDALVVGAGPAGATAAFLLAKNGYRVGVIEKERFPRFKLCGGLLSRKTIMLLEDIFDIKVGDLKANGVIHYQSDAYGVEDRNGNRLQGKLDFPFHFVDRNLFDLHWLQKATAAGAEVFFEEQVGAFDFAAGTISTQTGKKFRGRFIIAADGVFSPIRAWLARSGLINDRHRRNIAAALEIFIPRKPAFDFADHPYIYYGFTPWGYAWSFPGPRDQIMGICALKGKHDHSLTRRFNEFLKSRGVPAEQFPKAKGYALPYGNFLQNAGHQNILLVGDAGGFADPLLGEGIYYAHKSAQLACTAIEQSFNRPRNVLELYNRSLNRSVITELKYANFIRQVLFSFPVRWQFKVLAFVLNRMPGKWVEAVQGQRSFKLLRPLTPI